MHLLLALTFLIVDAPGLKTVRQFHLPSDETMTDPHFMDFSADGELYVVERFSARILRWSADGKYLGSFSRKGQGPGEMNTPELIHVGEDTVWVWGRDGRISLFDRAGDFKHSFQSGYYQLRRLSVINENLLLVAHQVREAHPFMAFDLIDGRGKKIRRLKAITNSMFLTPVKGDNKGLFKGYAPEADIWTDKKGTTWFGFSEEPTLYRLNNNGDIVEEKRLYIPTAKANDQEIEDVLGIQLSLPNGQLVSLKDMPNARFSFDYDKAIYTHFNIRGDQLSAVLTPISGTDVNKGYSMGTYALVNFKTGKAFKRGRYRLPDDSLVVYNNGRTVAFVPNEEGDFEILEVTLPDQ